MKQSVKKMQLLKLTSEIGVCSTVVERVTLMQVYAGSSPTSVDHRKALI